MKLNKIADANQKMGRTINNKWNEAILKYDQSLFLQNVLAIIVFCVIGFMVYRLNQPTPWVVDDLLKIQTARTIHSIGQLKDLAYNFYMHWGGRVWGEINAQVFLMGPKSIFNKINTLGYLLLLFLMQLTIRGNLRQSATLLLFIHFSLMLCLPAFGQDVLWISGAANYLWASLIPVLFFALWRCFSVNPLKSYDNSLFIVASFFIGIFAGWANENVSVALLFMGILYWIYFKYTKDNVPRFSIVGWIGLLIGSLFLWGAPGNFVRFAAEKHSKSFAAIAKSFVNNILCMFDIHTALLLIIAFIILIFMRSIQNKIEAVIFLLGSFVAAVSFSVIGTLSSRIFFGPIVLMTIAVGILLEQYITCLSKKRLQFSLCILMLLGSYNFYQYGRMGIIDYANRWNANQNIIKREIAKGNLDVFINPMPVDNKFCATFMLDDIKPQRENKNWLNTGVAKYFGLHTIQSIEVR